mmetsp:Transcript_60568/g.88729  ORF Transcript_60568/g.88729 Transcript_60568/m.88729 type:complete len:226 (-) Transcript_60568:1127-1804(-)
MECVSETRLLALFRRERLDGLQVEVVVQMKVIQILTMDKQIEHIVALSAHLQTRFDPVDLCRLEKFGRPQNLKKVALVERLRVAVLEPVEHVAFQQLLVAHTHFDRVVGGAVFLIPLLDQRYIKAPACGSRTLVEGVRRPIQGDAIRRVVSVQWHLIKEGDEIGRQLEFIFVVYQVQLSARVRRLVAGNGVDEGIEIKARQVGVLHLNVRASGVVVHRHVHLAGT